MIQTQVLIQLPTDPSYWGSTATQADVSRILDNLQSMIRAQFAGYFDLTFERTATPRGSGVHSDDNDAVELISEWISDNWTAAL
jgi:hypothetical protein